MSELHFYFGTRNTWYGEPIHQCGYGDFESHDKSEVLAHVAAANAAEQATERMREDHYDSLANTR